MTAISTINLTKRIGERIVLDNVNLQINTGEFHILRMMEGLSRHWLLMVLGTIGKPSSGQALVLGLDVSYQRRQIHPKSGITLPQDLRAWPMTGGEYIQFFASAFQIPRLDVRTYLDSWGLGNVIDAPVAELREPDRSVLSIARAVLHKPQILIVDDPLASVDDRERFAVLAALRRAWSVCATVICFSSYASDYQELATSMSIFDGPRLSWSGQIAELFATTGWEPEVEIVVSIHQPVDEVLRRCKSAFPNVVAVPEPTAPRSKVGPSREDGRQLCGRADGTVACSITVHCPDRESAQLLGWLLANGVRVRTLHSCVDLDAAAISIEARL